jgi:hypothetical protein
MGSIARHAPRRGGQDQYQHGVGARQASPANIDSPVAPLMEMLALWRNNRIVGGGGGDRLLGSGKTERRIMPIEPKPAARREGGNTSIREGEGICSGSVRAASMRRVHSSPGTRRRRTGEEQCRASERAELEHSTQSHPRHGMDGSTARPMGHFIGDGKGNQGSLTNGATPRFTDLYRPPCASRRFQRSPPPSDRQETDEPLHGLASVTFCQLRVLTKRSIIVDAFCLT